MIHSLCRYLCLLAAWFSTAGCYSAHSLATSRPSQRWPVEPHLPKKRQGVPPSNVAIVLARNIRLCGSNVTAGIDILRSAGPPLLLDNCNTLNDDVAARWEPVFQAFLGVIAQAQKKEDQCRVSSHSLFRIALDVYQKCPTEACRACTISICGYRVEGYPFALQVLRQKSATTPNIQSYNAALAACAAQKDWSEASYILQQEMPVRSTMSCNIVLKAMSRARRGDEAYALLMKMLQKNVRGDEDGRAWPLPDRNSFHVTMSAMFLSDNLGDKTNHGTSVHTDRAFSLLSVMLALHEQLSNQANVTDAATSILPNNVTLDLLARAYGRLGDWKMVSQIENILRSDSRFDESIRYHRYAELADPSAIRATLSTGKSQLHMRWENENLTWTRKGKSKYWSIGRYEESTVNLTIALQPHRNPSKNGMKIVLLDNTLESAKVGYLLMVNDIDEAGLGTSTLLGMYLQPKRRQAGLSKVFLAVWLDLCRLAVVSPRTGIIRKPLLALVLQHTFGFVAEHEAYGSVQLTNEPSKPSGILVEISRGLDGCTTDLYAPTTKSLLGYFSMWDLKRDNIRILTREGYRKGRTCRIGARFVHCNEALLSASILNEISAASGTGRLVYNSVDVLWRDVILGKSSVLVD